jgi:hypothetical protein
VGEGLRGEVRGARGFGGGWLGSRYVLMLDPVVGLHLTYSGMWDNPLRRRVDKPGAWCLGPIIPLFVSCLVALGGWENPVRQVCSTNTGHGPVARPPFAKHAAALVPEQCDGTSVVRVRISCLVSLDG